MQDNLGEQGTFNSAVQWLMKLDEIERAIDTAFATNNYGQQYRFLNVYWSVLYEWMNDKHKDGEQNEVEVHDEMREKARQVNIKVLKAKRNGKMSILTKDLEVYWRWNVMIKKLIHKKGLRMPKKDDPRFALK